MRCHALPGLLSNQGEKSINFYFIMVPLKEKSIKVWYSKAQLLHSTVLEAVGPVHQTFRTLCLKPYATSKFA